MKKVINHLLKPTRITLAIFGVLAFIFLMLYVWNSSFSWIFDVTDFMVVLLIFIIVGLLISIFLDRKINLRLKSYFIIVLIELLFVWPTAKPITTWQVNASFSRANEIIESLDKFKTEFGMYPATLKELEEKLKLDLPDRTYLGTLYTYEQHGHENYWLTFISYHGFTASYSKDKGSWIEYD